MSACAKEPNRRPNSSTFKRPEQNACAKEPNRRPRFVGTREAGRMSACAKEPNRQPEVIHIRAT